LAQPFAWNLTLYVTSVQEKEESSRRTLEKFIVAMGLNRHYVELQLTKTSGEKLSCSSSYK
jgi:hypothetical protein